MPFSKIVERYVEVLEDLNKDSPNAEVWYCWREYAMVEGMGPKRLLVPWSDPAVYEFPMDWLFSTPQEAWDAREEVGALEEEWYLCKETLEVVEGPQCASPNQLPLPIEK